MGLVGFRGLVVGFEEVFLVLVIRDPSNEPIPPIFHAAIAPCIFADRMRALPILTAPAFGLTVQRLCRQLIEDRGHLGETALIGLQPRGVYFARRLRDELAKITGDDRITYGELDITFHRDDFRQRAVTAVPGTTQLDFSLDDRRVLLIDDVLYTGRTIRAGLDALMAFGRPRSVELMVLIDRRFSRELPIQPDYVGRAVDALNGQRVNVEWLESDGVDRVTLTSENP